MTSEEAEHWFYNARELSKCKQHRSVVADINQATAWLPEKASLPERLYHLWNNTSTVPPCKTCGAPVSWDRRFKQYKTFCGNPRCAMVDAGVQQRIKNSPGYHERQLARMEKTKTTNLTRYGHTNYLASPEGKARVNAGDPDRVSSIRDETRQHEYKVKRTETMVARYGAPNYSTSKLDVGVSSKLKDEQWLHDPYSQVQLPQKKPTTDFV